jgi:hypothetical protein
MFWCKLRAPLKIRFFRNFFRYQIYRQLTVLDVGAREQIWEHKNYPKKAIFRSAIKHQSNQASELGWIG